MVDGPEKLFPEPLHGNQGGLRSRPPTPAWDKGWAYMERVTGFGKRKRRPRKRRKAR